MQVEEWPIGDVKPYPNNPRTNDAGVDAVAASLSVAEEWRAVPGYEGLYEVSSHGRVRRSSASRMAPAGYVRQQRLTWDGYPNIALSKRQRYWHVKTHRLVALAFLGPPPFPGAQVAHYDGDKTNNRVSNLRWATASENAADKRRHGRVRAAQPGERHHMAKLTAEAVRDMRRRAALGEPVSALAAAFGVAKITAYDAIFGITWRCETDPPPLPRRGRRAP